MFIVTAIEAAAIRRVFVEEGELPALIELRRCFPDITDSTRAGECALIIAGWPPAVPGPDPQRARTGRRPEPVRALDRLGSRRNDPYEAALAALPEGAREWWAAALARDPEELDEGEAPATADAEGLHRFLEAEVLPWLETRKTALANRPLVREQAFGEALNPDKLERLGRYEVHLDRKLERMLSMLLRLKDLRRETVEG
jgi:hypothetical protein